MNVRLNKWLAARLYKTRALEKKLSKVKIHFQGQKNKSK